MKKFICYRDKKVKTNKQIIFDEYIKFKKHLLLLVVQILQSNCLSSPANVQILEVSSLNSPKIDTTGPNCNLSEFSRSRCRPSIMPMSMQVKIQ